MGRLHLCANAADMKDLIALESNKTNAVYPYNVMLPKV